VIQDEKLYKQNIEIIQRAATQSATLAQKFQDEAERIIAGNASNPGTALVGEVTAKYKKIRAFHEVTSTYIQTFIADMANPSLSTADREKMRKMINALKAAASQFAVRMSPLLYQSSNYIHVLERGTELSGWRAGIIWTADPYGLNKDKEEPAAAASTSDTSPQTVEMPQPAVGSAPAEKTA
jgi:hypothetical protein